MRFFLLLWAVIEILQVSVIGLLFAAYRKLQRQVDQDYRFAVNPPGSVVDDKG